MNLKDVDQEAIAVGQTTIPRMQFCIYKLCIFIYELFNYIYEYVIYSIYNILYTYIVYVSVYMFVYIPRIDFV